MRSESPASESPGVLVQNVNMDLISQLPHQNLLTGTPRIGTVHALPS